MRKTERSAGTSDERRSKTGRQVDRVSRDVGPRRQGPQAALSCHGLERLALCTVPRLGREDRRPHVALLLLEHPVLLEDVHLHHLIAQLGGEREGGRLLGGRVALLLTQRLLDLVSLHAHRQRAQQRRQLVGLLAAHVDVGVEELAQAGRLGEQLGHLLGERVRRRPVWPAELAERRGAETHEEAKGRAERRGEVGGGLAQGLLSLVLEREHGVLGRRLEPFDALLVLVVPKHGVAKVDG
mmetsp:Transcript_14401/g.25110  ORF Transcript_14401/g.25110 Transcript_14401/m.25110 type:complete len:240 (-) Transcript_14401:1044-1763(-)